MENERSKGQSVGEMRQKWCWSLLFNRLEVECLCLCVVAGVCMCVFVFMSGSQETVSRLLLERSYPVESLQGSPAGIDTQSCISKE